MDHTAMTSQAIIDADHYQRKYGGAHPKISAQIAFSIGAPIMVPSCRNPISS